MNGRTLPVRVHFDDLDAMGLLHNSRYALLVERAVNDFWAVEGWNFDPARSAFEDIYIAVREFKITYSAPIIGPGDVHVHFWVERIGRTSAVYGFRVLSADGGTVHAEGHRVNVNLDPRTFLPKTWSERTLEVGNTLLREPAPA
ncbi:acyl-CoA thioesterase [Actinocorallia longicatena]|uniref:Hotdog domain-containing protein n=1 Tax=Actinocorallia longicatena TaxID=111803 RepID=A0ABP6QN18_9ACTN